MAVLNRVVIIASVLVLSLLLLQVVEADQVQSTNQSQSSPATKTIDCGAACEARCQLSSRPNLCKRACGTCCVRCQCVPRGTSGNDDSCPCYATMTTHDDKLKLVLWAACEARCELSRRPNLCKRACGTCCVRCQCIPHGTSGNDDSCPCYATMTTHDNKLKCP